MYSVIIILHNIVNHAGGPRGEKPGAAAPPPAARAAAVAAGGGPCAPLWPLLSSVGARRRLHPPAALPGQSRQRARPVGNRRRRLLALGLCRSRGGGRALLRPPRRRLSHPRSLPPGWAGPAGTSRPLAPTRSAGRALEPAPRLFSNACRSRTRSLGLRRRPEPRPGRCQEGGRGGGKSRENPSLSLPSPAPPLSSSPPGSPAGARCGDVTAGGRALPASRCGERMREESGGAAVSPPRSSSVQLGGRVCRVCRLRWIQRDFADRVSLRCPTSEAAMWWCFLQNCKLWGT